MLLDIVTSVWQIPFLAYEFAVESVGSLSYNLPGRKRRHLDLAVGWICIF